MNEYIRLLSLTSLKTRGRDNIESIPAESRKVKEAKKKKEDVGDGETRKE